MLTHEHLGAAGITVNGPGTRPVQERALARTVLELLALAEQDVPRADLFRVLAAAPVRTAEGTLVPVSRWERLSRKAGVVGGEDWGPRLTRFADDERARLADEQQREDQRPDMIDRLNTSITDAEALRRFAAELRQSFTDAHSLSTWSDLSSWALELVQAALGDGESLSHLPAEEQYAAVAVPGALAGLAVLDELGSPASLVALRDTLATQLEDALPRVGRFGDGVLVAPVSARSGSTPTWSWSAGWPRRCSRGGSAKTRCCPRAPAPPPAASWSSTANGWTPSTASCWPRSEPPRTCSPRSPAVTSAPAANTCPAAGCCPPCARSPAGPTSPPPPGTPRRPAGWPRPRPSPGRCVAPRFPPTSRSGAPRPRLPGIGWTTPS